MPARRLLVLVFIATTTWVRPSLAADSDCSKLLQPDITSVQTSDFTRLAYLYSMSSEDFDQASRGLGAAAGLLVDGLPIKGMLQYSDFSNHLKRESERLAYTYERQSSMWFYTTRVPADRTKGFVECMNPTAGGLVVSPDVNLDPESLYITIGWEAPAMSSGTPATLDFRGSKNVKGPLPSMVLNDRARKPLRFDRLQNAQEMVILITTGTFSTTFHYPVPLREPTPLERAANRCLSLDRLLVSFAASPKECELVRIAVADPTRQVEVGSVTVTPNTAFGPGSEATCKHLPLGRSCDFLIDGKAWHATAVEIGVSDVAFRLSRD